MKKSFLYSLAGSVALSSLLIGTAFAQTTQTQTGQAQQGGWQGEGRGDLMRHAPGVFGEVTAISGTTLTVTAKEGPRAPQANANAGSNTATAGQTYTVDASSATVTKDGSTSSLSAIAVGDTVMVQGTVSGSSIAATEVHDGVPQRDGSGERGPNGMGAAAIQGNGQPVVGGSVTAVNGSTISVQTAQGDITYSVDAANATVRKDGATSTVSAIATGDKVVVQGTVNGTSVTASTVIDQGTPAADAQQNGQSEQSRGFGGFFGAIGGFFHRLFGFF